MLWSRCPTEVTHAKAWCLLRLVDAPQDHPTWDPGGASWRECRASSKKLLKSFARGDGEESRSWTCRVKDAKAPACCALAAPECNVTSERFRCRDPSHKNVHSNSSTTSLANNTDETFLTPANLQSGRCRPHGWRLQRERKQMHTAQLCNTVGPTFLTTQCIARTPKQLNNANPSHL